MKSMVDTLLGEDMHWEEEVIAPMCGQAKLNSRERWMGCRHQHSSGAGPAGWLWATEIRGGLVASGTVGLTRPVRTARCRFHCTNKNTPLQDRAVARAGGD